MGSWRGELERKGQHLIIFLQKVGKMTMTGNNFVSQEFFFFKKSTCLIHFMFGQKALVMTILFEKFSRLKTPPATPLFPSLEMETTNNLPELLVQREIPILQPLTRVCFLVIVYL